MQVREFSGEEFEQVAGEGVMPVIARTQPGLRGRITQQGLGAAVSLRSVRSSGAMRTLHTDRMARSAAGNDLMIFCVHVAGSGYVRQHDRFAELRTGTAVLSEARSRWELATPGGSRSLAIHFSRELLPMRTHEISESCARGLDPRSPAVRVLAGYLKRLDVLAPDLNAEQCGDAGRAAIDLLLMALREVAPAGPDGSAPVLLEMLRAYVRDHLADTRLSVDELARRHHVSARHVHALFQDAGTSPGSFIRAERLHAARGMLADSRFAGLAVSRIAAMTGFTNVRTFERAFRREFDATPGEWRHEH